MDRIRKLFPVLPTTFLSTAVPTFPRSAFNAPKRVISCSLAAALVAIVLAPATVQAGSIPSVEVDAVHQQSAVVPLSAAFGNLLNQTAGASSSFHNRSPFANASRAAPVGSASTTVTTVIASEPPVPLLPAMSVDEARSPVASVPLCAAVGSAEGPLGCFRALRDAWSACRGEGGIGSEGCKAAGKIILLECSGVVGSLITCIATSTDFWDFVLCMI